jgi:hypothetical protein
MSMFGGVPQIKTFQGMVGLVPAPIPLYQMENIQELLNPLQEEVRNVLGLSQALPVTNEGGLQADSKGGSGGGSRPSEKKVQTCFWLSKLCVDGARSDGSARAPRPRICAWRISLLAFVGAEGAATCYNTGGCVTCRRNTTSGHTDLCLRQDVGKLVFRTFPLEPISNLC